VKVVTAQPAQAVTVLRDLGLADVETTSDHVSATLGALESERVTAALVHAGVGVRELVVERPDLEDVFVALTGEGFDVDE